MRTRKALAEVPTSSTWRSVASCNVPNSAASAARMRIESGEIAGAGIDVGPGDEEVAQRG